MTVPSVKKDLDARHLWRWHTGAPLLALSMVVILTLLDPFGFESVIAIMFLTERRGSINHADRQAGDSLELRLERIKRVGNLQMDYLKGFYDRTGFVFDGDRYRKGRDELHVHSSPARIDRGYDPARSESTQFYR